MIVFMIFRDFREVLEPMAGKGSGRPTVSRQEVFRGVVGLLMPSFFIRDLKVLAFNPRT